MRILVVGDEPAAREFMARALMRDHHGVETASGGEDALRRLQAAPFDCVVTDIRMPGMSGPELHRHTEATDSDLASSFIFVTGDTASADTLEFLSSTANRHLMKPIDAAELRLLVAEVQEIPGSRT